ncbi:MAG: hypothetical protein ABIP93_04240 [Gemmatimonadaceae bacterium]
MSMRRALCLVIPLVALSAACAKEEGPLQVRGTGYQLASLEANQQAAVNKASLSAAFDPDPSLSLLVDPVYLPRSEGRLGGASVAPALIASMKERGTIRGTCQTPRDTTRTVPVCPAALPGYVVRFSEIFRIGTDSVEVYLAATRYRRAPKEPAEMLTFERIYQLAKVRGEWRVMKEARLPNRR